jgi:hypothetical protein
MPNWGDVLHEINNTRAQLLGQANSFSAAIVAQANSAQDTVRRKYLAALHAKTGRNIIGDIILDKPTHNPYV